MISDEDIQRVSDATDIVSLVSETTILEPRGNEMWGCCPFHKEKSASFHINASTGLWYCFGCQRGGNLFKFVQEREHLEFEDAVRYLAERAHIDIAQDTRAAARGPKRTRLIDALEAAQAKYNLWLRQNQTEGASAARAYCQKRGFNIDVCKRWNIGFADSSCSLVQELKALGFSQDELVAANLANTSSGRARDQFYNRLMFPIHDEQGRCIGFGGRVMGDAKPKYINTRETSVFHKSKHMFAFDKAKETITSLGYAIITEGYVDVISMHEAGFTNTVATLGTALSADHIKTLSRFAKTIICMFDGDAAGQHAAEAAVRYYETTQASMLCVVLPDNQDPDEFLKAHGAEAMKEQIAGATDLLQFVIDKRLETLDLSSPGLRIQALDGFAKLLAPLKNSYMLDNYAERISNRLGLDFAATKEKIRATPIELAQENSSAAAPIVEDVPQEYYDYYEEEFAPQQSYVPAEFFSPEMRKQNQSERNLLTLLAKQPDLFRPFADRIASFEWTDSRYETIAWAILATPAGTTPANAVALATRACKDAPELLASGQFDSISSWETDKNIEFVVDQTEICSLESKMARLTEQLETSLPADSMRAIVDELKQLRARRDALKKALPAL